jgi:hypothetical protein
VDTFDAANAHYVFEALPTPALNELWEGSVIGSGVSGLSRGSRCIQRDCSQVAQCRREVRTAKLDGSECFQFFYRFLFGLVSSFAAVMIMAQKS